MADIAERLGISIVSVSKGLAGKDGVSEEMRVKILATAEEMGYVMPLAKTEGKNSSGNIGILVADRFIADNAFMSTNFTTWVKMGAIHGPADSYVENYAKDHHLQFVAE
jgi:LacI family transcriptional regulator